MGYTWGNAHRFVAKSQIQFNFRHSLRFHLPSFFSCGSTAKQLAQNSVHQKDQYCLTHTHTHTNTHTHAYSDSDTLTHTVMRTLMLVKVSEGNLENVP